MKDDSDLLKNCVRRRWVTFNTAVKQLGRDGTLLFACDKNTGKFLLADKRQKQRKASA